MEGGNKICEELAKIRLSYPRSLKDGFHGICFRLIERRRGLFYAFFLNQRLGKRKDFLHSRFDFIGDEIEKTAKIN